MATNNQAPRAPKATVNKYQTADDLLAMSDDEVAGTRSGAGYVPWVNVMDILYQPITVTDAYLEAKFDENRGKEVTKAYVTFYYADDSSRALMRFSSGWSALRKYVETIQALNAQHRSPFPFSCGVVEMVDREPFVAPDGRTFFPLRFAPLAQIPDYEARAGEAARQQAAGIARDASTSSAPASSASEAANASVRARQPFASEWPRDRARD